MIFDHKKTIWLIPPPPRGPDWRVGVFIAGILMFMLGVSLTADALRHHRCPAYCPVAERP